MSIIINFPGPGRGVSADEMMAFEIRKMYSEMGQDSLAARNHEQSMYVALGHAHDYWGDHDSGSSGALTAADIASLDSRAVAGYVAADLGPEGRTGVERIVANLVQHARKFIEEHHTPPNPANEMPGLRREIESVLQWKMARLASTLPRGMSYVIRGTIEVNLSVDCASGQTESAA